MKKQSELFYDSPIVEIVEIEVEKGFAASGENGNWTGPDHSPASIPTMFNSNPWE